MLPLWVFYPRRNAEHPFAMAGKLTVVVVPSTALWDKNKKKVSHTKHTNNKQQRQLAAFSVTVTVTAAAAVTAAVAITAAGRR